MVNPLLILYLSAALAGLAIGTVQQRRGRLRRFERWRQSGALLVPLVAGGATVALGTSGGVGATLGWLALGWTAGVWLEGRG